jgi:hypothetical protein
VPPVVSCRPNVASESCARPAAVPTLSFRRLPGTGLASCVVVLAAVLREEIMRSDLAAEDFEVLDGKPQPIALFANNAQPIAAVVMRDTSINTTLAFDRIREAAQQFVLRLRPDDLARVCAFNDKIQFGAQFHR